MKPGLFSHRPMLQLNKNKGTIFTGPFVISLLILLVIIGCCVLAPLISPISPVRADFVQSLSQPSSDHLWAPIKSGATAYRLFYGGRTTHLGSLGWSCFACWWASPWLASGKLGGKADMVIGRFVMWCFFSVAFAAFIFVAGFGRCLRNAIIALGCTMSRC